KDGQPFSNSQEDLSGLFSGQYSLEVQDVFGCMAVLGPISVSNTSGTPIEQTMERAFQIFPNPVSTCFQFEHREVHPVRVRLLMPDGIVLRTWDFEGLGNAYCIDDLPTGQYLLHVETRSGVPFSTILVKGK
ncbi:MAG: hypothetical protein ACKVU2_11850, partial [Saprospiraceae bacterium]